MPEGAVVTDREVRFNCFASVRDHDSCKLNWLIQAERLMPVTLLTTECSTPPCFTQVGNFRQQQVHAVQTTSLKG